MCSTPKEYSKLMFEIDVQMEKYYKQKEVQMK